MHTLPHNVLRENVGNISRQGPVHAGTNARGSMASSVLTKEKGKARRAGSPKEKANPEEGLRTRRPGATPSKNAMLNRSLRVNPGGLHRAVKRNNHRVVSICRVNAIIKVNAVFGIHPGVVSLPRVLARKAKSVNFYTRKRMPHRLPQRKGRRKVPRRNRHRMPRAKGKPRPKQH